MHGHIFDIDAGIFHHGDIPSKYESTKIPAFFRN